ncbi:MAG: redoxin family protein [Chitinophagaceae bacterium]
MSFQFPVSFLLLVILSGNVFGQDKFEVIPSTPERGQKVTLRYNPSAQGATIPTTAENIDIVFTYSNFYEMPWRMPLYKRGKIWETSFVIPPYATYATFYLQSGETKDQPAGNKHYELAVYENNKRIQNSYLYEGYSLSAQLGKVPDLEKKKAELFEKELKNYPNNYEAKLRQLNYKISVADPKDKEKLREEARAVIAAKFYENPGNQGLMNKTTMGYLIIGENSRLDSIRQVIRQNYPESEAGYSMRISEINSETDKAVKEMRLLQLLKNETPENHRFFSRAHEILFNHYASLKQTDKALYHLDKINKDFTPYTASILKGQAEVLLNSGIALETALRLAKNSLVLSDTFPVGLIRHFPETGHIPSFVSREERKASMEKSTATMMTLIALIRNQQGFKEEAETMIEKALAISQDVETLSNSGEFYQLTGNHEKAFNAYKKIMIAVPEDTVSLARMKENYRVMKKGLVGWESQIDELNVYWKKEMMTRLKKEIINKKSPDFVKALVDLNGKPLPVNFIKDKIVVVDFWATWCVPCIKEMPYVQNAFEKYKDRKDVLFMVVNSGSNNTLQDAQGWSGNKTYSFPVFYNTDRSIGEKFGFNVIPATYIIDKKGNVRFETIGFEGPVIQRKIEVAIELLEQEM